MDRRFYVCVCASESTTKLFKAYGSAVHAHIEKTSRPQTDKQTDRPSDYKPDRED